MYWIPSIFETFSFIFISYFFFESRSLLVLCVRGKRIDVQTSLTARVNKETKQMSECEVFLLLLSGEQHEYNERHPLRNVSTLSKKHVHIRVCSETKH